MERIPEPRDLMDDVEQARAYAYADFSEANGLFIDLIEREADGLLATCMQHEIDHLDGKLFIDYLKPLRRQIHHALDGEAALRSTETAKGASYGIIRVNCTCCTVHRRHAIRSRRMDRDAIGNDGPTRRICTGIEVGMEEVSGEVTVRITTQPSMHCCWVTLGCGRHALRTRVDAPHRPVQFPCSNGHVRLDGHVYLAAEPAADRRGYYPYAGRLYAQNPCNLVSIHIRCLGGNEELYPIAVAYCIPSLRLNVSVLDKACLELPLHNMKRSGNCFPCITGKLAATNEYVSIRRRMQFLCIISKRGLMSVHRRQLGPYYRDLFYHRLIKRACRPDNHCYGFTSVADIAVCEHGLIAKSRKYAVAIIPWHIFRSKYRQPRVLPAE